MDQANDFERAKTAYEQNFEQFRSLNQVMWQVPVIAMSLTGGLWFGAASVEAMPGFQYLLLILAALANLGLVVVLARLRFVMDEYLTAIQTFAPQSFVSARGKWFHGPRAVSVTFRTLLLLSAAISLVGIGIVYQQGNPPQTRRVIEVIELLE